MSLGAHVDAKEQVRQAIDIVDLVGSYLELRPQGSDYVAHCPWHDDRRPSLRVSRRRQTWRCWVCNIGGDIFSFVMRREGVDFREALEMLADRAGIALPRGRGEAVQPGSPNDKRTLYRAAQWAEQQYHQCLLYAAEAEPARRYLAERGISRVSIERYRLGYCPSAWQWLLERAKQTDFSPAVLEAVGILARSQRTGTYYDRFRDRIIFPIRDAQRRTIAFGGRILPQHAEADAAKYVNCPETRLYSKSETLFGLDVVRDQVARSRHLFIMEGYTDVIMAVQHGVGAAVAVCGTALGPRHLNVLRRYADRVTLVLDGDQAGRRRANELVTLFVSADIDVRILTLPEELDPCDFLLRHGAEAFQRLAEWAPDAVEHKIRQETEGLDVHRDTHRANQALERILQVLAQIPREPQGSLAAVRYEQVLVRLARDFGVPESVLRMRLDALKEKKPAAGSVSTVAANVPTTAELTYRKLPPLDRELLEIVVLEPSLIAQMADTVPPDTLQSPVARALYETCLRQFEESGTCAFAEVLARVSDPQWQSLWVEIAEVAEQKQLYTEATPQERLSELLAAWDRENQKQQRRALLASLDDGQHDQALAKLEQLYQLARRTKTGGEVSDP